MAIATVNEHRLAIWVIAAGQGSRADFLAEKKASAAATNAAMLMFKLNG